MRRHGVVTLEDWKEHRHESTGILDPAKAGLYDDRSKGHTSPGHRSHTSGSPLATATPTAMAAVDGRCDRVTPVVPSRRHGLDDASEVPADFEGGLGHRGGIVRVQHVQEVPDVGNQDRGHGDHSPRAGRSFGGTRTLIDRAMPGSLAMRPFFSRVKTIWWTVGGVTLK